MIKATGAHTLLLERGGQVVEIADQSRKTAWLAHYNELHPHKALGYRSPRQYIN